MLLYQYKLRLNYEVSDNDIKAINTLSSSLSSISFITALAGSDYAHVIQDITLLM